MINGAVATCKTQIWLKELIMFIAQLIKMITLYIFDGDEINTILIVFYC